MHRITLCSILYLFVFFNHAFAADSIAVHIPGIDKFQILPKPPIEYHSLDKFDRSFSGFVHIGYMDSIFISISHTNVLTPNYQLNTTSSTSAGGEFATCSGLTSSGGIVRLTLAQHHVYGYLEHQDETYYFEPARYYSKSASLKNAVVVYKASDVDMKSIGTCAVKETEEKRKTFSKKVDSNSRSQNGNCYSVELAVASDYSMFEKFNSSITEVELHNIGVINNVNGDYSGHFNDDIEFLIHTQFISDCPSCDPWTSSTNASTLLSDFSTWGQNGGFGVNFDLGELWTNRNLDGPTIGLAWLNQVCTGYKYHLLQDFTANATYLRVLASHEIGHNFSSGHDATGSPHIMAPTVQNTSSWSAASISSISDKISSLASGGCLDACGSGLPPTSAFSVVESSVCEGTVVQFTDETSDGPTSWNWTFPGGSPSTSDIQNPVITYNSDGFYDVILITTNAYGSDTLHAVDFIEVIGEPEAGFEFQVTNLTNVQFTNTSLRGEIFSWTFGNGTTSIIENPVVNYAVVQDYQVELSVTNECGSSDFATIIELGPCIQNRVLTGTIESGAYVAGNSISVQGDIAPNAEVYLHAPNGVTLNEGFGHTMGGEMFISNNGCTN